MKKLLLSTAIVLGTTLSASAGTLAEPIVEPMIDVMPAPTYSWSGPYAGLLGGWANGEYGALEGDVYRQLMTYDGFGYGAFLGYNYEMSGGMVIGAELAGLMGEWTDEQDGTYDATVFDLKARAGFSTGRALIYASGGLSMLTTDFVADSGMGWNVGAGADFFVTDSIFVGGEYVYRDITDSDNDPAEWEAKFGTIQLRVGMQF